MWHHDLAQTELHTSHTVDINLPRITNGLTFCTKQYQLRWTTGLYNKPSVKELNFDFDLICRTSCKHNNLILMYCISQTQSISGETKELNALLLNSTIDKQPVLAIQGKRTQQGRQGSSVPSKRLLDNTSI